MTSKNTYDIFDQLERNEIDVWDVISLYENGRDVHELEDILIKRPAIASNVLYIMSEISSKRIVPVWRSTIPFLRSADLNCVYYALDVIHGASSEIDRGEVASVLNNVSPLDDTISEKVEVIRNGLLRMRGDHSDTQ